MLDIVQIAILGFIAYLLLDRQKPAIPATVRKRTTRKLILDTCALIDGRIVELARAGFVPEQLIVPEFIIHELQLLADGSDAHKRDRARYGLDVVQELQDNKNCTVVIDHSIIPEKHATDDKLVALAKKMRVPLYTTDFNLNKVAEIEGVKVLNVNELAGALRPSALPGEKKTIKILQKGSNPRQGVGYLDDGTMLVVEDAAALVGKTVQVEITRMHQTVSGKMLFSELVVRPQTTQRSKQHTSGPRLAARKPANPSSSLASRMKR